MSAEALWKALGEELVVKRGATLGLRRIIELGASLDPTPVWAGLSALDLDELVSDARQGVIDAVREVGITPRINGLWIVLAPDFDLDVSFEFFRTGLAATDRWSGEVGDSAWITDGPEVLPTTLVSTDLALRWLGSELSDVEAAEDQKDVARWILPLALVALSAAEAFRDDPVCKRVLGGRDLCLVVGFNGADWLYAGTLTRAGFEGFAEPFGISG
jgi:hypothetical protein